MSQDNVDKIRQGYQAFARGDVAFILELAVEDVEWHPVIAPLLGVGLIRGKRALERFLVVEVTEGFTDFAAVPDSIEDLGDAVLSRTRYSGKGRASGVPVSLEMFALFRFRDGKIVSFRDYETRAEALEAAGLAA